jgi:ABC-type transport system involved in multi-copper enzyme maturation permease subunit
MLVRTEFGAPPLGTFLLTSELNFQMLSAKWLFATALTALIVAVIATILMAFWIRQFRFVVYVSVLVGVIVIVVGLIGFLTGKLKNDLDTN